MKISDVQFKNFKEICKKNDEFFVFSTDEELKDNVEYVISVQGYWSGMIYKYYLDGDNWRIEPRQFGSR